MELTRAEKERIHDSKLKIQSIATSLDEIPPEKIENYDAIHACLNAAEDSLDKTLEAASEEYQEPDFT